MGGEYLLTLNMSLRPIANKYREGQLQRTLKRELKDPEIADGEGFGKLRTKVSLVSRCICVFLLNCFFVVGRDTMMHLEPICDLVGWN